MSETDEELPFTGETVLVPVDGTEESTAAAEYAVAIADRYGAELQMIYVLGEAVVRALDSSLADHAQLAEEHRAYLDDLRSMASDAGVPITTMSARGFSTRRKARHPGSVVLDCAEEIGADFLVVPRQSQDQADLLAKTAEYVLSYATQPVLSV